MTRTPLAAPWTRHVLYQIYPRSFRCAGAGGVGDLRGVIEGLEHVANLGVDVIWLSPFFRSPMKDFGYDVEDHRAVDPRFGTEADFDALVARAQALGLRVVIDLILSHCADTHPWFRSAAAGQGSEYDDCFVWAVPAEDGGPPNNWLSFFGGPAWSFNTARGQYYLHNFLSCQPDWNFHAPRVRQEALAVARHWLDRGVDGFRLDAVNFCFHDPQLRDNPPAPEVDTNLVSAANPYAQQSHVHDKNRPEMLSFLADFGALLESRPGAFSLGEIGAVPRRAAELTAAYTAPGRLSLCYSFALLGERFDAPHLHEVLTRAIDEYPGGYCWAFSNHDVQRAASRLCPPGADQEAVARLSLALLLAFPGVPCLYQGEELGLPEAEVPYDRLVDPYGLTFWPDYKGRDGCRTPMPWRPDGVAAGFARAEPWLPIPADHRARAVALQEADTTSTLHFTRRLLRIRRQTPPLVEGTVQLHPCQGAVLGFARRLGDDQVLCLFNLSDTEASWTLDSARPWVPATEGCPPVRQQGVRLRLPPWGFIVAR